MSKTTQHTPGPWFYGAENLKPSMFVAHQDSKQPEHTAFICEIPPSTEQARSDIKHIQHARTFLKLGAALVALCLDTPHREKALRPLAATWEQVEAGTFGKEGTNVPTVLMSIRR